MHLTLDICKLLMYMVHQACMSRLALKKLGIDINYN
jgi:hypothetical protein